MTRSSSLVILGCLLLACGWLAGSSALAQQPVKSKKEAINEMVNQIAGVPELLPPVVRYVRNRRLVAESVREPTSQEDGEDEEDREVMPVPQRQNVILAKSCFETYIFGNLLTSEERSAWLNQLLIKKLNQVSKNDLLSVEDRNKLRLAARGDVKLFFDRVDEKRMEYQIARSDLNKGVAFLQQLNPLIMDFEFGPYGSGSLFSKTVSKLLDDRKRCVPVIR